MNNGSVLTSRRSGEHYNVKVKFGDRNLSNRWKQYVKLEKKTSRKKVQGQD